QQQQPATSAANLFLSLSFGLLLIGSWERIRAAALNERVVSFAVSLSILSLYRVTFKYEGSTIVPGHHGADYEEFIRQCTDDIRLFGFVRFTTGDAMSKRVKFALITWIGESVSGLQRAKTGTDKTLVKEVVQNFAKEFVISDHKELDEDYIKSELKNALCLSQPPACIQKGREGGKAQCIFKINTGR
uniref:Coactosin-like protein n=1 Tax=Podarcis muralis TaxID=64176 RepID=A0A670IZ36_PODMU